MSYKTYLVLDGVPIPKKRPRFSSAGTFVRTYDPQEKEKQAFSKRIKRAYEEALCEIHSNVEIKASNLTFETFFEIDISFYMPVPESSTNAQRNAKLWYPQHTIKPDIDNLIKFFLDCANGILFPDDSMIWSINAKKIYSKKPRTEIKMRSIKKPDAASLQMQVFLLFSPEELNEFIADINECPGFLFFPDLVDISGHKIDQLSRFLINFSEKYGGKIQKINQLVKKEKLKK